MKDINSELIEFFKAVKSEKKEQKQQIDSIIGNSFFEDFVRPLSKEIKSKNSEVISEEVTVEPPKVDSQIHEKTLIEKSLGLLSEPSSTKQQNDPLTPLDQNFVTFDQLQKHYKTFVERIQQQLSTLGGGGETNLTYMDVPIASVTTSSYTVKPQDYYVGVNYAGAVTITLPKADREGKIFVVKDERGEASKGTNRYITILPTGSDLIDGRDRAILAFDYGSLTFIWKSNSWRVI